MRQYLTEITTKIYYSLLTIIKSNKKKILTIVNSVLYVTDISLYLIEKILIMLMIIEIINNLPFSKEIYEIRLDEIKILAPAFLMYGFIILYSISMIVGKKFDTKQLIRLIPYLPLVYIFIKLLIKIDKTDLIFLYLFIAFCRLLFDRFYKAFDRYTRINMENSKW